ncbi:hypothetical protein HOY82DRAFT_158042 [Tuber indicum]|nr:hypothetical protein HOY82DRAFT_158042 [Tuber indicum]
MPQLRLGRSMGVGGRRLAGPIGEDIADAGNREFRGNARGEEERRKEGAKYLSPPPPFIFKLFLHQKTIIIISSLWRAGVPTPPRGGREPAGGLTPPPPYKSFPSFSLLSRVARWIGGEEKRNT